jgi:uncharacterized protein with ParB-like and HNH nuclease domain
MQASETRLQKVIEGTIQYLVPLFQRPYSWEKHQWQVLWDDLMELCNVENPRPHFMGSIVTAPTSSVPEGVTKYILIDGQQRLTTIFVVLAALRDHARILEQEELAQEINDTILVNRFKKDLDHYKLQPTQSDRQAFYKIIKQDSLDDSGGKLLECYRFFDKKLRQKNVNIQKIKNIICSHLSVVSVVLSEEDDPYLVFESLNAKGRSLTQADLIRNYFFMKIKPDIQEEIYRRYWQPIQESLGDNLTEFIRHYLTKNGTDVKQNEVYFEIKDRINQNDAMVALKDLYDFSKYYAIFLNPEQEENNKVRKYLERIKRLDVATVYPFLLNCYHDWHQNNLSEVEFIDVFKTLENFIIRRFVCNIQTRGLNRIFFRLYTEVSRNDNLSDNNFVQNLKLTLQSQDYPKDAEFKAGLLGVDLYTGNRSDKAKLILESIEESFNHKEQVPFKSLSLEHVMPQTLSNSWKQHLGEDWEITHNLLIHSLGNLTLTAYNSELHNSDFLVKREQLQNSHLEINKYFSNQFSWDRGAIEERANILSDIILNIWDYFGDGNIKSFTNEFRGNRPKSLQLLGKTHPVRTWRDVLAITMDEIAESDPEGFKDVVEQYPRFIGREQKNFRSSRVLKNGFFVEVNLGAEDIGRFCRKAIETIGLDRNEWSVETE